MSHNVVFKDVKFTDIQALRAAVQELARSGVNIKLSDKKTFRTYGSNPNTCDMVIELPGCVHDIGLQRQKDGTLTPIFDPYDHNISANVGLPQYCDYNSPGRHIGKLVQTYVACKTEKEAVNQGYSTTREFDKKTGTLSVVVEGY